MTTDNVSAVSSHGNVHDNSANYVQSNNNTLLEKLKKGDIFSIANELKAGQASQAGAYIS